jgi:hypothetical protein
MDKLFTLRMCACCGNIEPKMMSCSKCKFAHYCDADCQRADWKQHKLVCQSMREKYEMHMRFLALTTTRSLKSMTAIPVWLVRGAYVQINNFTAFLEECENDPDNDDFYDIVISKDIVVPVIPTENDCLSFLLQQATKYSTPGVDVIYNQGHQSSLTVHIPGFRAYFLRV